MLWSRLTMGLFLINEEAKFNFEYGTTTTTPKLVQQQPSISSSSTNQQHQQQRKSRRLSFSSRAWKRIRPAHGGTVFGEHDDFRVGKSCQWEQHGLWRWKKQWVCRDCGIPTTVGATANTPTIADIDGNLHPDHTPEGQQQQQYTTTVNDCPILKPRGKCPSFRFQEWDIPRPRSSSMYHSGSAWPDEVRLLTTYGVGRTFKVEFEQARCHLSPSGPCFDLQRCRHSRQLRNSNNETENVLQLPLAIYAYEGIARIELHQALTILSDGENDEHSTTNTIIRSVDTPEEACLLVVHEHQLHMAIASDSWNGGANHYVYGVQADHDVQYDVAFQDINWEMAAVGSSCLTTAHLRRGYDIALPLNGKWKPPKPTTTVTTTNGDGDVSLATDTAPANVLSLDPHRPRRLLLSFKGSIQDTLQPYYQHRWLAAEYWPTDPANDDDVQVDVQCKHKTLRGTRKVIAPYDFPTSDHFDSLMLDATFGFCPGGSGVSSYRLVEVLRAGGIPVLPPEIVTPFWPEWDWSACVVRVSQARIVDLPRLLRQITPLEIEARQAECQRLYHTLIEREKPPLPSSSSSSSSSSTTTTRNAMPQHEKDEGQQQHKWEKDNTNNGRDPNEEEEDDRYQSLYFVAAMKVWVTRIRQADQAQTILTELHQNVGF
jgi:hypothetical protein